MLPVTDKVIIEKNNGIGRLILNQPKKRNAISYEMWQNIGHAINQFSVDDDVRTVILCGAGNTAFSAGADISQFAEKRSTKDSIKDYDTAVMLALEALDNLTKPSIAMIQGYCVGGGASIVIHCDIRIAAEDAHFAIPAAKLGLAYGWDDVHLLVQLIGPAFAREILYTARKFNATEALQMGLVNRVVTKEELSSCVSEYASNIADNAPLTIYAIKQSVHEALKNPNDRDLDSIERLVDSCFSSKDYQEGRQAFLEKRKPNFKGH